MNRGQKTGGQELAESTWTKMDQEQDKTLHSLGEEPAPVVEGRVQRRTGYLLNRDSDKKATLWPAEMVGLAENLSMAQSSDHSNHLETDKERQVGTLRHPCSASR